VKPAISGQETARLLLVDKSDAALQNLRSSFFEQPLMIDHAQSISAARDLLKKANYDAILMEGHLADPEGLLLIRETNIPVILTSLPANSELILSAYKAGAADFFCGSVSEIELIIRLQSILNKRQSDSTTKVYELGKIQFDLDQRQWITDGKPTHLSHHEAAFLAALLDSPKHFCTYAQLLDKVWGPSKSVETQNLRVLAGQLRRKIEPSPDKPTLLLTVPGVGYKLALTPGGTGPSKKA
jgi:DNA-binding response OmpR family regulator